MTDFTKTNERYQEIIVLHNMLSASKIPHTFETMYDGWQVIYPNNKDRVADAVEHFGSYGEQDDKLEIMGLLTPEEETHDTVLGWLSAKDVYDRIEKHFNGKGEQST